MRFRFLIDIKQREFYGREQPFPAARRIRRQSCAAGNSSPATITNSCANILPVERLYAHQSAEVIGSHSNGEANEAYLTSDVTLYSLTTGRYERNT